MLWSSVQLMASAIASTPRQLEAVSCFSGVNKEGQGDKEVETKARGGTERERERENNKETKDTSRLIKTGGNKTRSRHP